MCSSIIDWLRSKQSAWLGVVAPLWGLFSVLIAAWLSPWFNWKTNAISDMGVYSSGQVAAFVLNSGLVIAGSLTILFIIGLWSKIADHWLERGGTIVMGLTGLSLVGIGVVPENFGWIHFLVSVMFFMLAPVGMWFFAGRFLQEHARKQFGMVALLLSLVTVVAWNLPWDGIAIPEYLPALADSGWVILLSWSIIKGKF
ncbi:MAG: DUF998 domain-containing protein [Candidatus Hodarchaeota archaeon]